MDVKEAQYVEGYCFTDTAPFPHGWILLPDGRIPDFTLDAAERRMRREGIVVDPTQPTVYLGVIVPGDFIRNHRVATGLSEPLALLCHQSQTQNTSS